MYQDIYNCKLSKYKINEDILSIMSNLQPNCCLKIDFQKVDQHAGGKWLIHDTKRRKDNQIGPMNLAIRGYNSYTGCKAYMEDKALHEGKIYIKYCYDTVGKFSKISFQIMFFFW